MKLNYKNSQLSFSYGQNFVKKNLYREIIQDLPIQKNKLKFILNINYVLLLLLAFVLLLSSKSNAQEVLWTRTFGGSDFDGSFEYSDMVEVEVNNMPARFSLEQNYPNPFNPSTVIRYHLPVQSKVTIKVFNILGNEVATLVNEEKQQGVYQLEFDASYLSSGIYFYTLRTNVFVETKKMSLIR